MDQATRRTVFDRADGRCEYRRLAQEGHIEKFSIDHVVARKHGGIDSIANLALCCMRCNLHKGTDLASLDPQTGQLVQLFNPRTDDWTEHFAVVAYTIVGTSPTGRATVRLLNMNAPERVRLRSALG